MKKGTGSEPRSENTRENNGREVPVPVFQPALHRQSKMGTGSVASVKLRSARQCLWRRCLSPFSTGLGGDGGDACGKRGQAPWRQRCPLVLPRLTPRSQSPFSGNCAVVPGRRADSFERKAKPRPLPRPDELLQVFLHFPQVRRIDVHHVPGLVFRIRDIAAIRRIKIQMVDVVANIVDGTRQIASAAEHQHAKMRIGFHFRREFLRHARDPPSLVLPRAEPS